MKVVEEYYWAITHAAADQVPVLCSLDFNWTLLYIRVHTYIFDHIYKQLRLAQNSTRARTYRRAPNA